MRYGVLVTTVISVARLALVATFTCFTVFIFNVKTFIGIASLACDTLIVNVMSMVDATSFSTILTLFNVVVATLT